MPITASAKKALRQSRRRRAGNLLRRRAMREALKITSPEALAASYKAIDKAMKAGVIKKRTAARKKARLARRLSGTKA